MGRAVAGGAGEGAFEVTGVWEDTAEGMLHPHSPPPPLQLPVPPGTRLSPASPVCSLALPALAPRTIPAPSPKGWNRVPAVTPEVFP